MTELADPLVAEAKVAEAIRSFLARTAPRAANQITSDDQALLGSGLLDSLGILNLVMFLSDEMGVEVSDEDFTPENFATIKSLSHFIANKRASNS